MIRFILTISIFLLLQKVILSAPDSIVYFPVHSIDGGIIYSQETYTFRFPFKNISNHTIKVSNVQSAGAISITYPKEFIQPEEWDTIEVHYFAERFSVFFKSAIIHFEDMIDPIVLSVKGNVIIFPFKFSLYDHAKNKYLVPGSVMNNYTVEPFDGSNIITIKNNDSIQHWMYLEYQLMDRNTSGYDTVYYFKIRNKKCDGYMLQPGESLDVFLDYASDAIKLHVDTYPTDSPSLYYIPKYYFRIEIQDHR
ncbi:MAG: hypothetical protein JWN78_496 [Bacteroidota bacterium]|nr:hypothetical protein [Bacteroidota bacterium]